jgi:hypothetical protein
MKRLLSVLAVITALATFIPRARSQDVSVDFFYSNLNGGSWFEVGNYGYCWQPDVAVNEPTWRPYADGYWAYTDDGWTWVSYEDFGWATYHYGRWLKLADYGWVWRPGYEWGPAWVSWRTGGNYIGWAPLPPETEDVYESRPLTGHLEVEFDIGPAYYNFVDIRYIGEPVLRSRLVPYQQNVTYISQTVNVTNITYRNKTVYNYGPDVNVVNQYSSRPIQRLKLERQTNVDVSGAAKSGGLTKVQGNALVVAAPSKLTKPAQMPPPPTVKAKVEQSKVEKGWAVAGDQNAQTQLREKIKTQDLKKVPPPTLGAAANASASANVSPGVPGTSPFEKGKGKNKNKAAEQMQNAPAGAMTSPGTSPGFPEGEKKKNKRADKLQQGAMASPATGSGTETSPMPESRKPGKAGKNRRGDQFGGAPAASGPATSPEGTTVPEMKQKERGKNFGAPAGGTTPQGISDEPSAGNQKKNFERQQQGGPPPSSQTGAPGASSNASMGPQGGPSGPGEDRAKHKAESANPPAAGEQSGAQQQGGKHEGKKKGPESPAPTPQ